nr:MAG TPA: hypothetical protein [Caudoviricetes sp.]
MVRAAAVRRADRLDVVGVIAWINRLSMRIRPSSTPAAAAA